MQRTTYITRFFLKFALGASLLGFIAPFSSATIVQFQTSLGSFEVNLYDETTPITVANFLAYVNDGRFDDVVIHRSIPGFIVQGGEFTVTPQSTLTPVDSFASIINEPAYSNVRGSIAMAKLPGEPNSATNNWFFNIGNNTNLDSQNLGFTVFGEVTGDGMTIVDAIGGLLRFNLGQGLTDTPLRDYTAEDAANQVPITNEHFMIVNAIVVIDAATDTASQLSPPVTTRRDTSGNDSGGGGGSSGFYLLFILGVCFMTTRRRLYRRK